jgi:hypothetical protein
MSIGKFSQNRHFEEKLKIIHLFEEISCQEDIYGVSL